MDMLECNVTGEFGTPLPIWPADLLSRSAPCGCAVLGSSFDATCEGCEHLWFDSDMGASVPMCRLGRSGGRCDGFSPTPLYRMYEEIT